MSLRAQFCRLCILCLCLLAAPAIVNAQAVTDYMYVTDYGNMHLNGGTDNVLRYSFTYSGGVGGTITNVQAAPSAGNIGANFALGLEAMTGTADSILTATANGINRYTTNGTLLETINVLNANGSAHTFNGIAGLAVSNDAQFLYVAEEGAGVVDKMSLSTGKIVATFALAGAHDVALAPDGLLYAAAYSANSGIFVINPSTMTQVGSSPIVASGANGTGAITRPTGLSFTGTALSYKLYAQSNVAALNTDQVGVFKITNALGTTSGTPVLGTTAFHNPGDLSFTFGNNIGPDGNLYIAALGDGAGTSMQGVTDGIYKFNTTTSATSIFLEGYNQTTSSIPNPATTKDNGVLVAPKYVVFNTDFSPSLDPGAPEPGTVAFVASLGAACIGLRRRRKLKS